MNLNLLYSILAIAISIVCSSWVIPNILLVSYKKGLFDDQNARKSHKGAVPRLGGVAFMPIILFTLSLVLGIALVVDKVGVIRYYSGEITTYVLCISSLTILFLIGLKDDLISVRFGAKFIAQIICGILLLVSGVAISDLGGLFFIDTLNPVVSYLLTVFLVVFIINAINLIDGIDGLASGLSIIALLYYGVAYFMVGEMAFAALAFASMGTIIPFFVYNVFGFRKRKIFMGDTGSLTIGFILSLLSLNLTNVDFGDLNFNPIVAAFAPLIVPCFDVVRVALFRMQKGNHPFKPDRNHIHHKFLDLGLSHRKSMISILMVSLMFAVVFLPLSATININLIVIAIAVVWFVLLYVLNQKIKIKTK